MNDKETLEEAAMKMYPIKTDPSGYDINMFSRYGFYNGAKWQAERMYSEEELQQKIDAHLEVAKDLWLSIIKEQKRMYSEEEVYNLLYKLLPDKQELEEWFEQFKKK